MRGIDEQMREIVRRKRRFAAIKALRRRMAGEAAVCAACALGMAAVAAYLPRLEAASAQAPIRQYGSLVLSMPAVGYVLVGLLSFILGVAATLLCRHRQEKKKLEQDPKERET